MHERGPQPALPRRATVSEYLRLEELSLEKHEYRNSEIVAMAGGTSIQPDHRERYRELVGRLRGSPCRVYDSNLHVHIKRRGYYTYPVHLS